MAPCACCRTSSPRSSVSIPRRSSATPTSPRCTSGSIDAPDCGSFHGPTVDDLVPGMRDPTFASLLTALTYAAPDHAARPRRRARGAARARRRPARRRQPLARAAVHRHTVRGTRGRRDSLPRGDASDPMSVVDERLVHLRASGLLPRVRGIVFGHLSLDRSEEDEFEDFVLDLVSDLDVPVLMDFPAGHEIPNLTMPLGTEVELVVEEETRVDPVPRGCARRTPDPDEHERSFRPRRDRRRSRRGERRGAGRVLRQEGLHRRTRPQARAALPSTRARFRRRRCARPRCTSAGCASAGSTASTCA